jgi:hypothetical protein
MVRRRVRRTIPTGPILENRGCSVSGAEHRPTRRANREELSSRDRAEGACKRLLPRSFLSLECSEN